MFFKCKRIESKLIPLYLLKIAAHAHQPPGNTLQWLVCVHGCLSSVFCFLNIIFENLTEIPQQYKPLSITPALFTTNKLLKIDISGHHTHCILSIQLYLVFFVEIFWFHTGHSQITVGIICSLFGLHCQNVPPHEERSFQTNEAQCPWYCLGQACHC